MDRSKPEHILVIRLSAMGDVAMTVPVLIALTQKYPELRVTVLTKLFFKPILDQIPKVSVHIADVDGKHRGFFGLWKLYKDLKGLQVDYIADLHNVLRSTILKLFFRLNNIPVVQLDKGRREKKALTAENNKVFEPLKSTHERYADVFHQLGFPIQLNKNHIIPQKHQPEEIIDTLDLSGKKFIGVAPFAAYTGKMYPLELMTEVLGGLNSIKTHHILLFGGGKVEQQQLESWEGRFDNCTSVVDKISFPDELKLISNLKLMLAMDSGNAHLAAMFGVPTITLWGVTHPYAGFYPFGQGHTTILSDRERFPQIPTSVYGNKFPSGYEKAMETISPNQVLQKIKETLN